MPDLADFIAQYATPYNPATDTYRRPPFASPVKAGKATAIYNAHSYHTKVPPQGIEPYIAHYTEPGDLVLDPFCGSGMTGVAGLTLGRRVILNDLSPAAAHIAYNYCTPVDVAALKREFERIKAVVKDEFDWLYGTNCDHCGKPAITQSVVWSDILECSRCGSEMVLWDVAVDKQTNTVLSTFNCPHCQKEHVKRGLRWLRTTPVLIRYECTCQCCVEWRQINKKLPAKKRTTECGCPCCRTGYAERPTTETERQHIAAIEVEDISCWYPTTPFDTSWEMWRGVHRDQGIDRVDKFYTKRNLHALAMLWDEINKVVSPDVRGKLRFAFTGISTRLVSKLTGYQFGKRGNVPVAGTLYIASFVAERNVWDAFVERAKDILKNAGDFPDGPVKVTIGSASRLPVIVDSSVDYIFTDPPFGSNIFYADCNFIWESWLGQYTDQTCEAVVHIKHKDKNTLPDYARLMTDSFREMYRVLKPNRWASVVFHNSDDKIWQTILEAVQAAGFELAQINSFDKEQLSFKGIRGDKGLERVTNKDIVLNLRKPGPDVARASGNTTTTARNGDAEARVVQQLADFLGTNPAHEQRTLQHFWNVVLHEMLANGVVEVSMEQVGDMLPYYFKQVDGKWYLRGEAVVGGNVFDLKSDAGALTWLNAVLSEPHTTGDLIPKWQAAIGRDVDPGRLERLLEQNFWLDKRSGRWRTPTDIERATMNATQDLAAEAHLRVIRKYLAGDIDRQPYNRELAEWVRFAYHREAYAEAVALYAHLDEGPLEPEFAKSLRKIVGVCKMKIAMTSDE